MENFKAKYTFPRDYKKSMKILYLNSYQNYNLIICISFCFLWIGSFLMITTSYIGYGLLLAAISLLSFFNCFWNLKHAANDFVKRQKFYLEYSGEKTVEFINEIYINESLKEYRYSDIEYLIEDKELFIIKFKFNAYIHIYKNDFTIGKPSELKEFLEKKNHSQRYIYAKHLISKNTILITIAVIILTIILLQLSK